MPLVSDFEWNRDGSWIAYGVSSPKAEEDGAFARQMSDGSVRTLLKGKGNYKAFGFAEDGRQLAFLSDQAEYDKDVAPYRVYYWKSSDAAASELVATATRGMPSNMVVSDQGTLSFSKDGHRLYLGTAPPPAPPAPEGAPEPRGVDLWHWKDPLLQPMQRVRAQQERNRSYRAVVHLADKRFVQLATPEMPTLTPGDDPLRALGTDDLPYRQEVSWDTNYGDIYLVDQKSGERKKINEHFRSGAPMTLSPGGRFLLYFDESQNDWFSYRIADGARVNLTEKLGLNFWREDHDTPNLPPAYGTAGWTADDRSVLLYDKYDIWDVRPDGSNARMVTSGEGRKQEIVFRYRSLDPDQRAIPVDKPLLLSANEDRTEDSGFYRVNLTGTAAPEKLLMLPKAVGQLTKAKNADRLVVALSRFDEFPDLWVTDTSFRDVKKVSDANPQQSQYIWGKAELTKYRNADGKELRAILVKPENFDPAKKYPLMVYIYEELSEGLHSYRAPAPGTSINVTRYVSNGYVVLMPDIAYDDRLPWRERGEVRHPRRQHRRRDGLHRSEADRHPGALVGRLSDHPPDHPDQHVRRGAGRRLGVGHDQRLRRHPLGHRHVARVPIREDPEPHRRTAVGRAAEVHRELADLLGGEGQDAVPEHPQRRRRCGAVVPGHRVLQRAAPPRQGGLHVRLQRRTARPAQPRQHEALDRPPGRVLRLLPAREAEARMDGEGRAVPRQGEEGRQRHVQAEGDAAPDDRERGEVGRR